MSDQEVLQSLSAVEALAVTLYGEARGEPIEGQIAVGCVVRNRVRSDPKSTYQSVVYKPFQFSCFSPKGGGANYTETMSAAKSMVSARGKGEPSNPPQLRQAVWVSTGLITGALLDNTKGADHYYAMWMTEPPSWASAMTETAIIGQHRFLRSK